MHAFSSKVNCASNVRNNSLYDLAFGDVTIIVVIVREVHDAALVHIGAAFVEKELNKRKADVDFHSSSQRCMTVLVWSSSYHRPFFAAQTLH